MSTSGRLANRVGASVLALAVTAAFGEVPETAQTYRWNEQVRPAIEAAICVHLVAGNFVPEVTGGSDCPVTSDDPILTSITRTITRTNGTLQWLFVSKLERFNSPTENADPARRSAIERELRDMTLRDGRLMHRYMPLVHATLAKAGAACPDCPGPAENPPLREVTLDQLMPYALRFIWPDAIEGSRVSLHICAGSNGVSELSYPDLDWADAALSALVDNPTITPIIEDFIHGPSYYPDAATESEQLAAIRRDLHAALRTSPRFRAAVSTALARKAQLARMFDAGVRLRVVCTDCRDAENQPKARRATPVSDAVDAYSRQNDAEALRLVRPLAESGLPEAQRLLGDMYFAGRGVPMDGDAAAAWYRKAADSDDAAAAFRLGRMYRLAQCGPRDDAQAARYFRKAAELGDVDGQLELASCYENGYGVPQDDADAARWIREAAERGYGLAALVLARDYEAGKGVSKDATLAYLWYSVALFSDSESARRAAAGPFARLADQLPAEQLAEAQRLAREWTPGR